ALVTGMQSGIDEATQSALRVSGLAHILSISGLHMALVAWLVMAAIQSAAALAPSFASARPVRKWAAGAALAAVMLYLAVSGAAIATIRSALMLSVMLVAILADRPAITRRNLALAALAALILFPHE